MYHMLRQPTNSSPQQIKRSKREAIRLLKPARTASSPTLISIPENSQLRIDKEVPTSPTSEFSFHNLQQEKNFMETSSQVKNRR